MNPNTQVAFYHIQRKEPFTGTIIGRMGALIQISYMYGKDKLVYCTHPKYIIPFST
jgi:hypothetical protein